MKKTSFICTHVWIATQGSADPVTYDAEIVNIPIRDFWVLSNLKNYPAEDNKWTYIDGANELLRDVIRSLEQKGYMFKAAQVRHYDNCSTPTPNFHIDCPFGTRMDDINTLEARTLLSEAGFSGFHNFIMTITDVENCTTRYIPHRQVRYDVKWDLRLAILNLHCKYQAMLRNPAMDIGYNNLCQKWEMQHPGGLMKVPINTLSNVVDYNFHRGPIKSDFKPEEQINMNRRRTLVHIECTRP